MVNKLNPMKRDGATVIKEYDNKIVVVMENGEEYTIKGDECSCGHVRDYTPSRSAGLEQSYKKRREASCKHQVALLNSESLGECPNCGNYQVREIKKRSGGRHVLSEYECFKCNTKIR